MAGKDNKTREDLQHEIIARNLIIALSQRQVSSINSLVV
jgi:hypothetical protein